MTNFAPPGATHRFWPTTRTGRWSVALFGLQVIALAVLVAVAAAHAGEWEAESFFDPLFPAVLLLVSAVSAIAAAVFGITGIVRQHERSTAVIMATALAGLMCFFFIGELLSAVGVLPEH